MIKSIKPKPMVSCPNFSWMPNMYVL
jgi:hypothetical protein